MNTVDDALFDLLRNITEFTENAPCLCPDIPGICWRCLVSTRLQEYNAVVAKDMRLSLISTRVRFAIDRYTTPENNHEVQG